VTVKVSPSCSPAMVFSRMCDMQSVLLSIASVMMQHVFLNTEITEDTEEAGRLARRRAEDSGG